MSCTTLREGDMTTMNNASEYASLSLNERVHVALDLAEKISMYHQSLSETVSAIVKQLTPAGDGVSPGVEALKLAEALLERLRDMRQHFELMDCLDSMRAGTAADLRACRAQQTT
jgi:hypothetical protein